MRKTLNKSEKKQFSQELEFLIDKKDQAELLDKEFLLIEGELFFFYQNNQWIPTIRALLKKPLLKAVTVDMGAVKFVANGADIMRPGIVQFDEDITKDELIRIIDEQHKRPLAVGKALFSGPDMETMNKGKVIQILHYAGDKLWNFNS